MKRLFAFLAIAGLVTFAAPVLPAGAMSLINPGAAAQTKDAASDLAIQVRHGGHGGFRGHGGGFHGGARFGGPRFVHHHHRFVYRPFVHRRHFVRPFPYYYAGPRLYCRWLYTDFGPRRVCRYRPWWA